MVILSAKTFFNAYDSIRSLGAGAYEAYYDVDGGEADKILFWNMFRIIIASIRSPI